MIALLRGSFKGIITDPETHIVTGPVSSPSTEALPIIAVYSDKIEFVGNLGERRPSQPSPQEIQQEIRLNTENPEGPYPLWKTPLPDSVVCGIISHRGGAPGRQVTPVENKDFTVDYRNAAILFNHDLSGAGRIVLKYSFVGVSTIREFKAELLLDVYDSRMTHVEKWASLANAIILTNHDELTQRYNFSHRTEYVANRYYSTHTINHIQALNGILDASGAVPKLQFKFQVQGQVKAVKEILEGYGLIEKIQISGDVLGEPVDTPALELLREEKIG